MNDGNGSEAIGDIVNLLAAPLAGGLRVVDQAWRGTEELIRTIEKLNRTLDSLNETSRRVNGLLEEFEEPIRAAIPQLTRTIRTADELTQLLEGPVRAAAPNIERLSSTLSQPGLAALPEQLGEAVGLLRDMAGRMAPLTMLAEGAGGLLASFGRGSAGTQPRPSLDGPEKSSTAAPTGPTVPPAKKATGTTATGTKVAGTKATGKKESGKKESGKKKATAGKSAANKKSKTKTSTAAKQLKT